MTKKGMLMQLKRRALIKWTLITLFCGGHSFFWGVVANGSIMAMIAGLATLILCFALVESSNAYQARRGRNARFARAMDLGIKIRIFLVFYVLLGMASMSWDLRGILSVVMFGYMGEVFIGMGATEVSKAVFGFQLGAMRHTMGGEAGGPSQLAYFANTYLTTLLTAAAHTLILALIIGILYGILSLRKTPKTQP